jgi:hypothetical protein
VEASGKDEVELLRQHGGHEYELSGKGFWINTKPSSDAFFITAVEAPGQCCIRAPQFRFLLLSLSTI